VIQHVKTSFAYKNTFRGILQHDKRNNEAKNYGLIENMTTPLGNRLKKARKYANIKNQAEAARLCGWGEGNQSRISNYETGYREPRLDEILRMAEVYQVSYSWLTSGMGAMEDFSGTKEQRAIYEAELQDFKSRLPVISWAQVNKWTPSAEPKETGEWAPPLERIGPRAFALKVRGDTMLNPNGKPSIPEDAVIIVDPDAPAENGRLVIAKQMNSNEAVFKKYVVDGNQKYLQSLNPQYPAIPIDDTCTIIGLVKYAYIAL
jgi:SOS-response transcriptional repressor LexA